MLVDRARILVRGGAGGSGCVSFRREKYVPRGGPDGGDGGRGGDVVLVASAQVESLREFRHRTRYEAGRGEDGAGAGRHGARGRDLTVPVPVGTTVMDAATEAVLADLVAPGQQVVVARGGRGGRGNLRFKGPTMRAPRRAEAGEPGEERWLLLEMRLPADVALVGPPNAGKSSLLARLTGARPQVEAYPFTTRSPNLGVWRREEDAWVMVDLPGLAAGAHRGAGLGWGFLRHAERARVLVIVVDAAGAPLEDYRAVCRELERYGRGLPAKPRVVAATRADLPEAQARLPSLFAALAAEGVPAVAVSPVTGSGIAELAAAIAARLEG